MNTGCTGIQPGACFLLLKHMRKQACVLGVVRSIRDACLRTQTTIINSPTLGHIPQHGQPSQASRAIAIASRAAATWRLALLAALGAGAGEGPVPVAEPSCEATGGCSDALAPLTVAAGHAGGRAGQQGRYEASWALAGRAGHAGQCGPRGVACGGSPGTASGASQYSGWGSSFPGLQGGEGSGQAGCEAAEVVAAWGLPRPAGCAL